MHPNRDPIPLPPKMFFVVTGACLTVALSGIVGPVIERVEEWKADRREARTTEVEERMAMIDAAIEDRAKHIAGEIEAVIGENRGGGRSHMLAAFFGGQGAMQVVFTIEQGQEWTGAFREEFTDAISDALRRGAIQFQLIAIPGVPETVVSI